MLPELYAGGDGPHIQRAEPGQPLRVPRRPPCRGPNSANDPQNPAPYRLQLLLAVSLIVLAVVIVLVILYRLSGLSLGLSAPPKLQVSSGCSPASSTFVWYLVWWSFFFPSPIISASHLQALCFSTLDILLKTINLGFLFINWARGQSHTLEQ
ncbi:sodium-coupled neutral amino acid transporter 5 isoform X2 [Dipodomys merriami]|uniref:sodium-coupled neutral amino acid transporter 5 isoform X2 n=1 Tax=Dipodomys merriami TaxID=94247 RepID=UPI0038556C54